jgi:hypothetical protein
MFPNLRGDSGKYDKRIAGHHKVCSRKHSKNGRNGNGLSPVEGTILKGEVFKCIISNEVFIANVRTVFEHACSYQNKCMILC